MTAPLFRFEAVDVVYDERKVLDQVNLDIVDGGITVIVGPSGSGKSTLLRLCNRLAVPTRGRLLFRGTDVAGLDVLAYRRRVGMVFQRPTMFPGTVRDNLLVADPDADDGQLGDILGRVALGGEFLDRTGDDLSGGEAQRVCLARTLLCRPEVLLADEPTSALDAAATAALERRARALADGGVPVLWVTHDLRQGDRLGDHRVVLADGHVADGAETDAYLRAWRPDADDREPSTERSDADDREPSEERSDRG